MSDIKKTMILYTAKWQDKKSFRLMPISKEAPYSELIYIPENNSLVVLSANTKESFHMVARLDDNGDVTMTKVPRRSGVQHKEQRVSMATMIEYEFTEKEEIINLINLIAVNSDSFDYKQYMVDAKIIVPEKPKLEIIKP